MNSDEPGSEVALKTEVLHPAIFALDHLESNRVLVGGLPVEDGVLKVAGRMPRPEEIKSWLGK